MYCPPARLLFCIILLCLYSGLLHAEQETSLIPEAAPHEIPSAFVPVFLEMKVNNQKTHKIELMLQNSAGQLFLSEAALQSLNFKKPSGEPVIYEGKSYYAANAIKDLSYKMDTLNASVEINAPASAFKGNHLDLHALSQKNIDIERTKGAFFNYDLSTTLSTNQSRQMGGLFEAGVFNSMGLGTQTLLTQQSPKINQFTRLQTTWTKDDPDSMRTLKLGDATTKTPSWGQAVLFGGFQWGTNFETRPGFVRYPLPTTQGAAIIPSSVDLYLNNTLLSKQNVPAGPFELTNIPVVTGSGVLQVVTTDLLGRQTISSYPFYTSPILLKPGLHNYSVSAGFIRNNYGRDSNNYGQFLMSAGDAVGVTDKLTRQWYAELMANQQTAGVGANFVKLPFGIFNASVAGSTSKNNGVGALGEIGFQRATQESDINVGFNLQTATAGFTRAGQATDQLIPALQTQVFMGIPLKDSTSVGLSYTARNNRGQPNAKIISLSYSRKFGQQLFATATGFSDMGTVKSNAVYLNIVYMFENNTSVNVSTVRRSKSLQSIVQLSKPLPQGTGYGYTFRASDDSVVSQNYQAAITAQNTVGVYSGQIEHQQGQNNYRLGIRGGIAFLDGDIYFSRPITNSFAVVQVPGQKDVGVLLFNQLAGRTNHKGNILLPNLLPYQKNLIGIDANDLTIDTHINTPEANPVPHYRSGVLIRFPVKSSRGVNVKLLQPSGQPIPMGAVVKTSGDDTDEFYVTTDGEAYIGGLTPDKHILIVNWENNSCTAEIHYPQTTELITNIGDAICR